MRKYLFIIILNIIVGLDIYEELIQEKVSEEYCKDVIDNIIGILKEGYVYLDFLQAPKQPEGKTDYIEKVNLTSELNQINTTNRTFYDFYADIQNVLNKARDVNLQIRANKTPNNTKFGNYYFCIPFKYYIKEIFDENNTVIDTFLTIESYDKTNSSCVKHYKDDVIDKVKNLNGKKIIKINGSEPYEYLEKMGKKGYLAHSAQ